MRRNLFRSTLALVVALAMGCQSYSFNPVARCLIQPGSQAVTMSNVSTADVLFVVDDSGSMEGEQAKLADAFGEFIASLTAYNDDRVSYGLEPFDFHIAITTTSLFFNGKTSIQTKYVFDKKPKPCETDNDCTAGSQYPKCVAGCGGFEGKSCCTPPITCQNGGDCAFPSFDCTADCGSPSVCCHTQYKYPQGEAERVNACVPGVAKDNTPYPRGNFVGVDFNPRILHYDKSLFGERQTDGTWKPVADPLTAKNKQGLTREQLRGYFASNVKVGTCGSGQEQGLEAGRLAIQKALAGQQRDMLDAAGKLSHSNGVPTAPANWPHQNSKLVVVLVADEDDCSAPESRETGIILEVDANGKDTCTADTEKDPSEQKQTKVGEFVSFLESLKRPLGAAFVVSALDRNNSANKTTCIDEACGPGICCDYQCTGSGSQCGNSVCGGQGAGTRSLQMADGLRNGGADVIAASICDPNFGDILGRLAEIVKPPSAVMLPTQPAEMAVTQLRIVRDGVTRKACVGPATPGITYEQAVSERWDWWFTASGDQLTTAQRAPAAASRYVFINHDTKNCEANPGESYVADYLGMVPSGGCLSDTACQTALGGCVTGQDPPCDDKTFETASKWTCYAGVNAESKCLKPTALSPGTCVCGLRTPDPRAPSEPAVCPNGTVP